MTNLMDKSRNTLNQGREELDSLFSRASEAQDNGDLRNAVRLYRAAAQRGDTSSQLVLGNLYIDGVGVRRNRSLALGWYRRAYRQGYAPAASNIAIVYRDEKKLRQALAWFERAVDLKDTDANLEIAKIYIERGEGTVASRYLRRVAKAKAAEVTEASREEAQQLLFDLK